MPLKPGDTAQLDGTGPFLSILRFFERDGRRWAECAWVEERQVQRDTFQADSLIHVPPCLMPRLENVVAGLRSGRHLPVVDVGPRQVRLTFEPFWFPPGVATSAADATLET